MPCVHIESYKFSTTKHLLENGVQFEHLQALYKFNTTKTVAALVFVLMPREIFKYELELSVLQTLV